MSDEINHHRSRFPETVSMTIAADQSPAIRIDGCATRSIGINPVFIDVVSPLFTSDTGPYPTAVLMELSALVRRVRATSPDSALADVADAKIGRLLAHGSGDNTLGKGTSRCPQ